MRPPTRAAIVALALIAISAATGGCATRNGDIAEFCKVLPQTAAISNLSPDLLSTERPASVAKRLRKVSDDLRRLERTTPRKVRSDVATTADFALRFANELDRLVRDPQSMRQQPAVTYIYNEDGPALSPSGPDFYDSLYGSPVYQAFNHVSRSYPGALKATSNVSSYAQEKCGSSSLPQGYEPSPSTLPGGVVINSGTFPGNQPRGH